MRCPCTGCRPRTAELVSTYIHFGVVGDDVFVKDLPQGLAVRQDRIAGQVQHYETRQVARGPQVLLLVDAVVGQVHHS